MGHLCPCQLYYQACCPEIRLWKKLTHYLATYFYGFGKQLILDLCLNFSWHLCGRVPNLNTYVFCVVVDSWVEKFWAFCSNSFHDAKDWMPSFYRFNCMQMNF